MWKPQREVKQAAPETYMFVSFDSHLNLLSTRPLNAARSGAHPRGKQLAPVSTVHDITFRTSEQRATDFPTSKDVDMYSFDYGGGVRK